MNHLSFTLQQRPRSAMPVVDGEAFLRLAADYETEHGFDCAGAYGALDLRMWTHKLDVHFGVRKTRKRVALLDCDCGGSGCWPLEATIRRKRDSVIWEAFENPFRPERDYSKFGPFVFDPAQYADAVTWLRSAFAWHDALPVDARALSAAVH